MAEEEEPKFITGDELLALLDGVEVMIATDDSVKDLDLSDDAAKDWLELALRRNGVKIYSEKKKPAAGERYAELWFTVLGMKDDDGVQWVGTCRIEVHTVAEFGPRFVGPVAIWSTETIHWVGKNKWRGLLGESIDQLANTFCAAYLKARDEAEG